jgi:hypothetical protein
MSGVVGTAYVVTFAVRNGNGTPRTGLVAGDFTVTVRNPGDTASNAPAVSEVGGGQYRFSIPGAFTTTHGAGEYGWTVELTTAPTDLIGGLTEFYVAGLDDLAQPGDAMDLVTDAVDADAVATSGANEIRDTILSDATPFAGANVDAAISSRAAPGDAMALTPAERATLVDLIWDELLAGHTIVGSSGEALAAAGAGGDPAAIADAVWDELQAGHVISGSFGEFLDAIVSSRATQAQILSDATPFAGANVDATISSRATQAQILSDATPFPGANVDATISSRSSHSAADVDTTLSGTHGAGSWATATGFAVPGDAMALTGAAESAVAAAVGALSVDAGDGGQDLLDAVKSILSMSLGRFVQTDISATVKRFQFYERDGTTTTYQLEITEGSGRERLSG